jgi:hypothetical protein
MANKKYPRTATISLKTEDWKRIETLKKKLPKEEATVTAVVKHALKETVEK